MVFDVSEFSSGMAQLVGMRIASQNFHLCGYLPKAYFAFCLVSMFHHIFRSIGKESIKLLHLDMYLQYINCVLYVGIGTPVGILFSMMAFIVSMIDLNKKQLRLIAYLINIAMIAIASYPHPPILYIWSKAGVAFLLGVYYDNGFFGVVYHMIGHVAAYRVWHTCTQLV